jgi:hypothetical protein
MAGAQRKAGFAPGFLFETSWPACGVSGLAYTETCVAFRGNAPAKRPAFNAVSHGPVIAFVHCNVYGDKQAEWDTKHDMTAHSALLRFRPGFSLHISNCRA